MTTSALVALACGRPSLPGENLSAAAMSDVCPEIARAMPELIPDEVRAVARGVLAGVWITPVHQAERVSFRATYRGSVRELATLDELNAWLDRLTA